MSFMAPAGSEHLAYRGPQLTDTRQRALAVGGVVALHAAVIGAFVIATLKLPIIPPEPTLAVSFITEEQAALAPTPPQPPQPTPPPPERQMMATPRPTESPMSAPPMEKEPPREVAPQAPAPPAPPAPSAPSAPAAPGPVAVTPPNFRAAYLNNPQPAYPQAALRRRIEGTVTLRVQVSPEGAPAQVLLEKTSGNRDLDTAAIDIVKRRWKFAPAKQGDRAVMAWVIVPMEFYLKGA